MDTFNEQLLKRAKQTKSLKQMFKIPLELLQSIQKRSPLDPNVLIQRPINILLLTSTCNGFGDVIFSIKLKNYLNKWYPGKVNVTIATNSPKQFTNIGERPEDLIYLQTRAKNPQCRKFNTMTPYEASPFLATGELRYMSLENYDLYFVAPLTADDEPDFKVIHKLVKNSNRFNTAFFTEYNIPMNDDIMFNVGAGGNRVGLFLTDEEGLQTQRISVLNNPYSIIYIAEKDSNLHDCYEGFLQLLTRKYKIPQLDVVCPSWMEKYLKREKQSLVDSVNEHYCSITVKKLVNGVVVEEVLFTDEDCKSGATLTFRMDVFPLRFEWMNSLYKHSLPHVLLTGDQSITDFLSCCAEEKIPFYQGLPWKQNFYTNLAKLLPNKYFKSYKTSCGNYTAIRYHPSFKRFIKKWDFRVNAKPLMDVLLLTTRINSEVYEQYKELVVKAKTIKTVKKALQL